MTVHLTAHPFSRRQLAAAAMVVSTMLLAGCVDADAQLSIGNDDTVDGQITIVPSEQARAEIEQWQIPAGFQDRVVKETTNTDNGETEFRFQNLGFEETTELISTATDDAVTLDIQRSGGDQVSVNGAVDLQLWPGARVKFDIDFPKDVISTNGQVSEGGEGRSVSWDISSTERKTIWATATAGNDTRNHFFIWLVLVSGAGLLATALSILFARRDEVSARDQKH